MSKNIFIWVGHPSATSFTHALADAFEKGAKDNGANVRRMNLCDMNFDPDLTFAYKKRKDLEPCLNEWRDNTQWANHLCWVYPQWWGGMPAKAKGVLDRAFLPGFAMEYHENDPFWDGLLKGRSATVIMPSDAPHYYDRIRNGAPALRSVKRMVLNFSGIRPVKTWQVGTIKTSTEAKRAKWLIKAESLGKKSAN